MTQQATQGCMQHFPVTGGGWQSWQIPGMEWYRHLGNQVIAQRVKSVEYFENGMVKRIEYYDQPAPVTVLKPNKESSHG